MLNLRNLLESRRTEGDDDRLPVFFHLSEEVDVAALRKLLTDAPDISIVDQLESQLRDLVKLRHPERKLSETEYTTLIQSHIGDTPLVEYGVWVYYPWRKMLVHLLDESEFVEVRTIRNRYKITAEEQAQLAGKKIGVIGLSVGQSVSLALALERVAGEIRIADMDVLELSNLNRIRSAAANVGLKKTVMVAREIAEIDPFLSMVCFDSGIDRENVDAFLTGDGGIDLLVEECDDVAVKILVRQRCRALGIPVLMDTSDRGMIDIERYDLDRNYKLLHGKISEDISYEFLRSLETSEDKLPYITPFSGVETLSKRMKASALEVGQTITTWPQLASDVILGGAVVCNLARRVLLGEDVKSQRKWIDLDEIFDIGVTEIPGGAVEPRLTEERVREVLKGKDESGSVLLDQPTLQYLIEQAVLAPSPGNTQRWKWVYRNGILYALIDKTHNDSVGDNGGIASLIGIGAAIENLSLAAAKIGLRTLVKFSDEFPIVASIMFERGHMPSETEKSREQVMGIRTTNRSVKVESEMTAEMKRILIDSFSGSGASLTITSNKNDMSRLGEFVRKADKIRMLNPQAHYEFFKHELNITDQERNEGLDLAKLNLSELDRVGLRISTDWKAIEFLKSRQLGNAFLRVSKVPLEHASGLGIISVPEVTTASVLEAGQLMERMWLDAEANGMGIQPMTYLMVFIYGVKLNTCNHFSFAEREEIINLTNSIEKAGYYPEGHIPLFLFRIHTATSPGITTRRREVADALIVL